MKITAYRVAGSLIWTTGSSAEFLDRQGCFGDYNTRDWKHIPHSTSSISILSVEEALYLLKTAPTFCLLDECEVTFEILHRQLIDTQSRARFHAYAHYRSQGWIVKQGVKYGVDFFLYPDRPGNVHSTFGVVVVSRGSSRLEWHRLISLCRVTDSIRKKLVVCVVEHDKPHVCSFQMNRWFLNAPSAINKP